MVTYYPTLSKYKSYNNAEYITSENLKYINDFKEFVQKKNNITGAGLVNKILKNVPLPEMHLKLPSDVLSENIENGSFKNTGKYSYCGPGTKVNKRLQEGYQGINSLDKRCKEHDIFYSKNKTTKARNIADDILAKQASEIALDPNEPEYVRNDAKLVTGIMGLKSRFGMGLKKKVKKPLTKF